MKREQYQMIRVPGASIHQHLGKIYVVTDDDAAFDELDEKFTPSSQRMFVYEFSPEEVPNPDFFADDELAAAATQFGAQFVTIIPDPEAGDPVFLMYDFDLGDLCVEAMIFACEADKRIRESLCRFADKNGKLVYDKVKDYPVARGGGMMMANPPTGRGAISFTGRGIESSKQEKKERLEIAKSTFVEDVMSERTTGDPEAAKRIDTVLKSLSNSSKVLIMKEYLGNLSEEQIQQLFKSHINNALLAKESKVKIIVRKRHSDLNDPDRFEDLTPTQGEYRICYKYGDEPDDHLFDFKMRDGHAIFLCCLMMRYEYGDKNIDFEDLEDMFIGAFRYLYGDTYETVKGRFHALLDTFDENGRRIQGYLKDRFRLVRNGIDSALLRKEDPHIFYPENHSHLHLLKENIILPPGLMETVARLGRR